MFYIISTIRSIFMITIRVCSLSSRPWPMIDMLLSSGF